VLGACKSLWLGAGCLRFMLGLGAVAVPGTADAGDANSSASSSSRSSSGGGGNSGGVTAAALLGTHAIAALSLMHLLGTVLVLSPGGPRDGGVPSGRWCCLPGGGGGRVLSTGGGGGVRGLTDKAISEHSKLHAFLHGRPDDDAAACVGDSCVRGASLSPVNGHSGGDPRFLDGESRFLEMETNADMSIDGFLDGRGSSRALGRFDA
jgi:hypothetical protein